MKKLIAGNWKMNGTLDGARALIAGIVNRISAQEELLERCEFLVCPPFLHIGAVRHALAGYPKLTYGGQDCAAENNGAHTGDISASMLRDSGCRYVILGHSERRNFHGETDALIQAKAKKALAHDLVPIICVGETEGQREAGQAEEIVGAQLAASIPPLTPFDSLVVAYEPVWAIGTGKTPTTSDIKTMHGFIAAALEEKLSGRKDIRILYGGSLKPKNAREILTLENVGGGLIGGASLQADSFIAIAEAV